MKILFFLKRLFRRSSAQQPEGPANPGSLTLHLVFQGEHTPDGVLTLQGSIHAGLTVKALAGVPLSRVLSCDTPGCRVTAEKIAAEHPTEGRGGISTIEEMAHPSREALSAMVTDPGITEAVYVVDEQRLEELIALLEERAPEAKPVHRATPASISRIVLSEDLSYRMRFNDTTHLESIVSNHTAGMRMP